MTGRFSLLGVVALALSLGGPAVAADALSYDDPGMHFNAPAGWTRVDLTQAGGGPGDAQQDLPAAVFVYDQGRSDQRSITVQIQPYDGTLESFESHHESELHSGGDSAFVQKHDKVALANGMPAFFLQISSGSDAGKYVRRYEYVVFDSKRAIVVTYAGRQGDFDDKEAKAALSTLYVVAYPRAHP